MTDQEKLKIAAQALEQSIGGQAACLRAVELTLEALRGAVPDVWADSVMEQAQVFASAWSLVGGRFDFGSAAEDAEAAKNELRAMLESAPQPAAPPTGLIVSRHLDPLTGAGIPDPTTFGGK